MKKKFTQWHVKKEQIQYKECKNIYFKNREIWWCSVGCNVGFEEDGKGEKFARPVVVLKKFNQYVFLGVPLSTTKKRGKYYIPFPFGQKISVALISQVRLFDRRRLIDKMGTVEMTDFNTIQNAVKDIL